MIITITGKPCSGKGTVAKEICEKHNFQYIGTGEMFRNYAKQYGYDVLSFQEQGDIVKEIDRLIDNQIYEIGQSRINENIVIDSRLAWHFIPNSFKVFVDIDEETAAQRLLSTNRETEKAQSVKEAKKLLKKRWDVENARYQELYGIDNLDPTNYDLVISSKDISPSDLADIIFKEYLSYSSK